MSAPDTHLSSLALDALELGALPVADEAAARAHLDECARCRGDRQIAREAREHFARVVLPRTAPSAIRQRPFFSFSLARPWMVGLPVLAAAAVLLVLWPRTMGVRREEGILVKGSGPALRGFARRGEHVFPVVDGTRLAPGDDLRFVVEPAGRRYCLIASVDGAGHATVYYPYGGTASAPVAGAPRVELPGSIHLDAAPGPERVFAVLTDEPIDAAPVLADLRALGAEGVEEIRRKQALDGASARATAAQATFLFEKELR